MTIWYWNINHSQGDPDSEAEALGGSLDLHLPHREIHILSETCCYSEESELTEGEISFMTSLFFNISFILDELALITTSLSRGSVREGSLPKAVADRCFLLNSSLPRWIKIWFINHKRHGNNNDIRSPHNYFHGAQATFLGGHNNLTLWSFASQKTPYRKGSPAFSYPNFPECCCKMKVSLMAVKGCEFEDQQMHNQHLCCWSFRCRDMMSVITLI